MRLVQRYNKAVWENEEFEEKRRDNCMCLHCDKMKPDSVDHCKIAQKFFEICKEYGCAFILTRCSEWEKK